MLGDQQDVPSWENIKISIDPIPKVLDLLDFLADIDEHPNLYSTDVVNRAIQRYETIWMPLASSYKGRAPIAPPMDVYWVWHSHMLAPVAYRKDCITQVSTVIDHAILSKSERVAAQERTRRLWRETTNVPYDVSLDIVEDHYQSYQSKCEYDLAAAAVRQSEFFYQVSLPHFKDEEFLQKGLDRYKKLLYLASKNPGHALAPYYDMDIIWHAHQLHPLAYGKDTTAALGYIFNHDDRVNDRKPGAKLDMTSKKTTALWQEMFGEEHRCKGVTYRGKAPRIIAKPSDEPEGYGLQYSETSFAGCTCECVSSCYNE